MKNKPVSFCMSVNPVDFEEVPNHKKIYPILHEQDPYYSCDNDSLSESEDPVKENPPFNDEFVLAFTSPYDRSEEDVATWLELRER